MLSRLKNYCNSFICHTVLLLLFKGLLVQTADEYGELKLDNPPPSPLPGNPPPLSTNYPALTRFTLEFI